MSAWTLSVVAVASHGRRMSATNAVCLSSSQADSMSISDMGWTWKWQKSIQSVASLLLYKLLDQSILTELVAIPLPRHSLV